MTHARTEQTQTHTSHSSANDTPTVLLSQRKQQRVERALTLYHTPCYLPLSHNRDSCVCLTENKDRLRCRRVSKRLTQSAEVIYHVHSRCRKQSRGRNKSREWRCKTKKITDKALKQSNKSLFFFLFCCDFLLFTLSVFALHPKQNNSPPNYKSLNLT